MTHNLPPGSDSHPPDNPEPLPTPGDRYVVSVSTKLGAMHSVDSGSGRFDRDVLPGEVVTYSATLRLVHGDGEPWHVFTTSDRLEMPATLDMVEPVESCADCGADVAWSESSGEYRHLSAEAPADCPLYARREVWAP